MFNEDLVQQDEMNSMLAVCGGVGHLGTADMDTPRNNSQIPEN
jgi:hypothetical protein